MKQLQRCCITHVGDSGGSSPERRPHPPPPSPAAPSPEWSAGRAAWPARMAAAGLLLLLAAKWRRGRSFLFPFFSLLPPWHCGGGTGLGRCRAWASGSSAPMTGDGARAADWSDRSEVAGAGGLDGCGQSGRHAHGGWVRRTGRIRRPPVDGGGRGGATAAVKLQPLPWPCRSRAFRHDGWRGGDGGGSRTTPTASTATGRWQTHQRANNMLVWSLLGRSARSWRRFDWLRSMWAGAVVGGGACLRSFFRSCDNELKAARRGWLPVRGIDMDGCKLVGW